MTDSKPFAGKLALVTGASRGIGAATAEALAAAGAHVILVARTAAALEEVEERIHAAGGSATIAPLDLTDGESIGKLAGAVAERWEKLDMLVLNAAMLGSLTPVQDIDPKEYSRLLSLNLLANQALIAAFDPLLRTSGAGGRRRADLLGRRASRAPSGAPTARPRRRSRPCSAPMPTRPRITGRIRVHIVDPGATRTRMRALAFPGEEPDSVKPPEVVAQAIVERLLADAPTGEKVRVEA